MCKALDEMREEWIQKTVDEKNKEMAALSAEKDEEIANLTAKKDEEIAAITAVKDARIKELEAKLAALS